MRSTSLQSPSHGNQFLVPMSQCITPALRHDATKQAQRGLHKCQEIATHLHFIGILFWLREGAV